MKLLLLTSLLLIPTQKVFSGELDGKVFCRSVTSAGFGQPKRMREHCLSFDKNQMTDNKTTFFGNPPKTFPYRIDRSVLGHAMIYNDLDGRSTGYEVFSGGILIQETGAMLLLIKQNSVLNSVDAEPGDKITTSLGAMFVRVVYPETGPNRGKFGQAWRAPNGLVWSEVIGRYNNLDLDGTTPVDGIIQKSPATEACKAIGGKLPTYDEYTYFRKTYFARNLPFDRISEEGAQDLLSIFPDMKGENRPLDVFWTASGQILPRNGKAFFPIGNAINYFPRTRVFSVRCVSDE